MKNCQFCAEKIQEDAVKCRYCNSFQITKKSPSNQNVILNNKNDNAKLAIKNESLKEKMKSIHWFVKMFFYLGIFSLVFFQTFRNLAIAIFVLSLYSAYLFFRTFFLISIRNRRIFYLTLSVMSFIGVFIALAVGQLLGLD